MGGRAPRSVKGVEYWLGILTALGPLTIDMYLPALQTIADDLGVTMAATQLTLAVYFAGFAIGQLLVGPSLDRFGRVIPLRIGLLLYMLGCLGCAIAPNIDVLIASRFIQALGGAVGVVAPRTIVRDVYRGADVSRAMSRLVLVMGIAPIVAPMLGGFLLEFGWRTIFWVLVGAGSIGLLVTFMLPETHDKNAKRESVWTATKRLLSEPDYVAFTAVGGFAQAGLFAYITSASDIFLNVFSIAPGDFGFYFAANATMFIISSQVNGYLMRYFKPEQVLNVSIYLTLVGACIVFCATILEMGGLPLLMAGMMTYLSGLGMIGPNVTAMALEKHGARAGMGSALMGCFQSMLSALAATSISGLNDGTARPMGIVMSCAIVISIVTLKTRNAVVRAKARKQA